MYLIQRTCKKKKQEANEPHFLPKKQYQPINTLAENYDYTLTLIIETMTFKWYFRSNFVSPFVCAETCPVGCLLFLCHWHLHAIFEYVAYIQDSDTMWRGSDTIW